MTQSKRIIGLAFSLFVFWAGRGAQAQTRTDLIEAARTEKEAHLTPYAPNKGERIIDKALNSVPYRILTGEVHGLSVSFGNMVPGSGFAIGPAYKRPMWEGKLLLRADARAAVNESFGGRVELSVPRLLNDHMFLTFISQHRNVSEMPYYGPGPD